MANIDGSGELISFDQGDSLPVQKNLTALVHVFKPRNNIDNLTEGHAVLETGYVFPFFK